MKITQIKELIPYAIEAGVPIYLWGVHGIGKTELVHQWAEENGYNVLVWPLSLMEPGDVLGCPEIIEGKTITAPPSDLPREGKWIVFIDEFNRARVDTQNAAFKFIDDTIPRYKRPEDVYIIAAGNPSDMALDADSTQQNYHVTELDPALGSRFLHVLVEPAAKEWVDFAEDTKHNDKVVEFVKGYQESLGYAKIALPPIISRPRGLTYLSKFLNVDLPDHLVPEVSRGLIGPHFAVTFNDFLMTGEIYVKAKDFVKDFKTSFDKFLRQKEKKRTDLVNRSITSLHNYLKEVEHLNDVESEAFYHVVFSLSTDMQIAFLSKWTSSNQEKDKLKAAAIIKHATKEELEEHKTHYQKS